MARNVGSIEVSVEANTGKLKAQIVKGAKAAGEAGGEALEEGLSDIEATELMAKLRKIRVQAQQALAGLEVDLEVRADATTELKRIEAQVRAAQIELFLTPEVSDADLDRELAAVRADLRTARPLKVKGEVVFDPIEIREAAARAEAVLEIVQAKLPVALEVEQSEIQRINAELDAQLRDIKASIGEIDGSREIALLRAQIEASLSGIDVGVDVNEARADLRQFTAEAKAQKLQLEAALDDSDVTVIATKVRGLTEEQRTIFFDTEADLSGVRARIEELEAQDHAIQLLADLDARLARARLEALTAEFRRKKFEIELQAVLDRAEFEAQLVAAQLAAKRRSAKIPVAADLTQINRDLESLQFLASTQRLDITVGAEVDQAIIDIEALQALVESGTLQLGTEAEVTKAQATLATFRRLQERDDVVVPVTLDVDVLEGAVEARLAEFEGQRHVVRLLAELDDRFAQQRLERFAAQRREVQMQLVVDRSRFQAQLAAEAKLAERRSIKIPIVPEADLSAFNRSLEALRVLPSTRKLDIDVGADVSEAVTEIRAAIAIAETGEVSIVTVADLTRARAAIDAFRLLQENNDIDLPINVDLPALEAFFAKAATMLGEGGGGSDNPFLAAGQNAGKSFSSGMQLSLHDPRILGGLIVAFAQPAAVALEGVFGAAVAVVSSGMSALIGTAGAAIPILAGLGTTVGALVIGLEGMGAALGGDADALARLTPEAREFAQVFAGLKDAFTDLRQVVQESLFAGLGDELERVANVALPGITAGLDAAADSLNAFFHDLADLAADVDFAGVFEALQPAVDSLLDALVSVAATIEPFLLAAAPAAQLLADYIADGAEAMADMVGSAEGAEKITAFLDAGIDSLRSWGGLLGEVSDALITLFSAGREAGDGFVDSLAGTIDRFDAWMESVAGQNALADFFDRAKQVMADLGPLVNGLIGFFDRIVTPEAIDRFGQMTDIIGDLLPVFATLLNIAGDVLDPFIDILDVAAEVLGVVAAAFEAIPDPIKRIGAAFATLGFSEIDNLIGLFGDLIGVIGDLIGWLDQLADIEPPGWLKWLAPGAALVGAAMDDNTEASTKAGKAWGGSSTEADSLVNRVRLLAEVMNIAWKATDHTAEKTKLLGDKFAEQREQAKKLVKTLSDYVTKVIQANDAMDDMTETFEQIGIKQDALSAIFDLGNAPLDAAASIRDIEIGIDELSETAKDVKVGDILAGNVKADEVLDAIDSMRPEIQALITDAFAADGAPAATAMAQSYIEKVAEELGITEIEAAKLLGLDDITAKIAIAFQLSEIEQARRQLEALTSLTGDTPFTASIALALDAGAISADQAFALVQPELEKAGVTIPAELRHSTAPEVVAAAKAALAGVEVEVPLSLVPPTGEDLYNLVNAGLAAKGLPPIKLDFIPPTAAEAEPVIDAALAEMNLNPITAPVTGPLPADLEDAVNHTMAGVVPDGMAIPLVPPSGEDLVALVNAGLRGVGLPEIKLDVIPPTSAEAEPLINAELAEMNLNPIAADVSVPLSSDVQEAVNTVFAGVVPDDIPINVVPPTGEDLLALINAGLAAKGLEPIALDVVPPTAEETKPLIDAELAAMGLNEITVPLTGPLPANLQDALNAVIAGVIPDEVEVPVTFPPLPPDPLGLLGAIGGITAPVIPDIVVAATMNIAPPAAPDIPPVVVAATMNIADPVIPPVVVPGTMSITPPVIPPVVVPATMSIADPDIPDIPPVVVAATMNITAPNAPDIPHIPPVVVAATMDTDAFDTAAEGVRTEATELSDTEAEPTVTLDSEDALDDIDSIQSALATLDETVASPAITVNTSAAVTSVGNLQRAIDNLRGKSVSVTVAGIQGQIDKVRELDREIDGLRSRTITVTTNLVTTGAPESMAGALVRGPQLHMVGERGYREAIIPLDLPLNRVSPEVRQLAAMIRGEGGGKATSGGIGRQVNNYMTITPAAADPGAVATQVLNRAAALANR